MCTLEKGLAHHHTECWTVRMRKANGEKAKTNRENAKVFADHFSKVFNNQNPLTCDPSVLDLIPQSPNFPLLTTPSPLMM
eukprot:9386788-Ditylum_brightwellii.AAC.1